MLCCQNKLLCVTVILIVSLLLIFSQYEHLHKMKKAVNIFSDPIETHNNKTEHKVTVSNVRRRSSIQSRRLNLVKNVCDGYRRDPDFNRLYVQNPGKKNRGKFTLEPKSKLFMCNVMKQGTTTWARIFIQLYLPKAANWKSKKWVNFSPFSVGYQVKLRELQTKLGVKKNTILKSLKNESHEYFAFFVCRNPIEKLKSLYSYSLDLNRFKRGEKPQNFRDFIIKLFKKDSTFNVNSMFSLCAPCSRHYDAIIKMETFSRDSREILRLRGRAGAVEVSHSNNHGSQTVTREEVRRLVTSLPRAVRDNMVTTLRPDFELCGYNNTLQWILEEK